MSRSGQPGAWDGPFYRVRTEHFEAGEALGGRYFRVSDGLIVRDPGIGNMTRVRVGLVENEEFTQVLRRLDG